MAEFLPGLKPELVIWTYYEGNDVWMRSGRGRRGDLEREGNVTTLLAYLEPDYSQDLIGRMPAVQAALREWLARQAPSSPADEDLGLEQKTARSKVRGAVTLQHTLALLKGTWDGSTGSEAGSRRERERYARHREAVDGDLQLFERSLRKAHTLIRQRSARPVFLYLPSIESFLRSRGEHPLRNSVLGMAQTIGFEVIDMRDIFLRTGQPFDNYAFGRHGGHFSPLGHARVAQTIEQVLVSPAN